MRWSRLVAIPLGTALILTAIPATAAFATGSPTGSEPAATAPAPAQPPGPVAPVDELEAEMLTLINTERAAVGVAPVQPVAWAHSVAVQHSQDMAAANDIWHNITGYIDQGRAAMGATYLGENVAMDSTLAADDALLYSDIPHRNVTLDARFNFVGIGIALDARNWVYVTEDFAQIPGGAAAKPVTTPAVHAPVAPAVVKLAAPKPAPKPVVPAVVQAAPVDPPAVIPVADPAVDDAAVAPAAATGSAQLVGARPVSHATPLRGGLWVLFGLAGLLLAALYARRFVAALGRPARTPASSQRPLAAVHNLGHRARTQEMWRPAA